MKFDNSKKLYEEAKKMVPGGVSSSIRQSEWPVPLFFKSAKGSKMTDVDGNQFIDYVWEWDQIFLGTLQILLLTQSIKICRMVFV